MLLKSHDSTASIIEIAGAAAGIVAADGVGFRFHAAAHRFNTLDGCIFATPAAAERAARLLVSAPVGRAHAGKVYAGKITAGKMNLGKAQVSPAHAGRAGEDGR